MSKAKRKSDDVSGDSDSEAAMLSFEGALDQLEQTVERLETGEMPLEEALELFETGVKLSRQCNETLSAAERRIEILITDRAGNDAGEASENFDFESEPEDSED